ncbi:MAG: hypothetical protein EHM61_01100 [Acidobacteria bacterium]|nr:MAG: hypothetical protein EHM61_01100 [Acidobacteriota bacterium]
MNLKAESIQRFSLFGSRVSRDARRLTSIIAAAVALTNLPMLAQVDEPLTLPPREFRPADQLYSSQRQLTFLRLPGTAPDYILGPGDLIKIQVVDFQVGDQTLRISASGQVSLPYLGLIDAANVTAEELENRIAESLMEKKLLKEPEVLVFVQEYMSKPIYILGEVDRAGQYTMTQQLYLMDAILLAGGLDLTAADRAFLHRRQLSALPLSEPQLAGSPSLQKPDDVEVIEVNLRPLKEGGMVTPNPLMRTGDVLFIPEERVDIFYIIGDVNSAGMFQIPVGEHLLASRGIAMAGGPTQTAKMSQGILVRYNSKGDREEHPVDFAAILEGRQPDLEIRPDDIIFIPGSRVKTLGYGMLNIVPRLATRTVVF